MLLSNPFDTNCSQLVRDVRPWSCPSLPSLCELSSSSMNRLSVCLSCLFWLCIPPVVCGRHVLCLRCLRLALFAEKKVFFSFFSKKNELSPLKKNSSRQPWRQPDVSCHTSAPPHLRTDVSPRQLSMISWVHSDSGRWQPDLSACLVLAARATVSSPDIACPDIASTRRSDTLPADPSSSPPPHQALRLRRKSGGNGGRLKIIIVISPGQIGQVKAIEFLNTVLKNICMYVFLMWERAQPRGIGVCLGK